MHAQSHMLPVDAYTHVQQEQVNSYHPGVNTDNCDRTPENTSCQEWTESGCILLWKVIY